MRFAVLSVLLFMASAGFAEPPYRSDRILLKPRAGRRGLAQAAHAKIGAQLHREYPLLRGIQVVKLPPGWTVKRALEHYRRTGLFEYVVPDYVVSIAATPNDPAFLNGTLWGLHNTGQNFGTTDADIDAPEAWDVRTNADSVIVAVIDTGVRYTHEDLATNMWTNPGEIPSNGIDDDDNGYVDDVYGINAITGSGDPLDDHGHGTHCAGTIGAVGNNGVGVVGVAWNVRIMALKFLNSGGSGSDSDAIECINYAVSKGAHILSNSWGCQGCFDQALLDAIAAARDAGIIFVAAAGNNSADIDVTAFYPASYTIDNLVSVAATTRNDLRAGFSNYGANGVDLGAPGDTIYSTYGSGDRSYATLSGTSMATPHVAGALAVVKAEFASETYTQLIWRVLGTTDPLVAFTNLCVTGGRLNLHKALTQSPIPIANFTATFVDNLTYGFTDASLGTITNRTWNFGDGSAPDSTTNPTHSYAGFGSYNVTLNISGLTGSSSKTKPIIVVPVTNYFMRAATFLWIDPTAMPALSLGDDEVSGALALPFTFSYYGLSYSNLFVSSNGMLGFDSAGLTAYSNGDIPNVASPNTVLYPFWDDLYPPAGGTVRFGITGTAPNRIAVASWVGVPHWPDSSPTFTFQALLYEGSSDIVFQYQEVQPGDPNYGAGRHATVGVENQTGLAARKYSFNGSMLLTNSQAILFTLTPPPPPVPEEPLMYSALATATNRIDVSWSSVSNATGYILFRDGVPVTATPLTSFSDTVLKPDTTHCYSVIATNGTGNSPVSEQSCATTLSLPVYTLDGAADFPGYLHNSSGIALYAAVHGQTLYVATQSPGTNDPNDHFIFVSDQVLPAAIVLAPWSKSGLIAVQSAKPFLAGESVDDTKPEEERVAWYIDDNAPNGFQLAAKSPTPAGLMEGTLDLVTTFGYLPDTLYIAAAAYSTEDGGGLVAQAPAGNGDGNLDPSEFLVLPVATLLDRNLDGTLDRLDTALDFKVVEVLPPNGGDFEFVWNAVPYRSYQVQYCDTLAPDCWQDVPGALVTAGPGDRTMAWNDFPLFVPHRFYRVKLLP